MVDSTNEPAGSATTRPRKAASRPAGPPTPVQDKAATKAAAKKTAAKKSAEDKPAKKAAAKKTAAKKSTEDKPAKKAAAKKTAAKKTAEKSAEDKPAKKAAAKKTAAKKTAEKSAEDKPAKKAATIAPIFQAPDPSAAVPATGGPKKTAAKKSTAKKAAADKTAEAKKPKEAAAKDGDAGAEGDEGGSRRRRRRGGRGRRSVSGDAETADAAPTTGPDSDGDADDDGRGSSTRRRRRRRRRGQDAGVDPDDPERTTVHVREPRSRGDEATALKGSVRLEAKRQRRREGRDAGRRRAPILTEAEFLARREAVDRVMVVRQAEGRTQIAVLEDGVLVEHYVDRGSSNSLVGNVYLGRVQNVLPSMEAAFVDIGRGRNAVLYAGEVNWDAAGLEGQPRRIEMALKSGDPVLVQVTKDPMGQKGARLTSQVSLPGRYLVYVPDGSMTGISRKLPDTERTRLKSILKKVMPEGAGVIVRTAAEGASEEELTRDVQRLQAQWEQIEQAAAKAQPPAQLSAEPDLALKVIRDVFNEDFAKLVVSGAAVAKEVRAYVDSDAPDLAERVETWTDKKDVFAAFRVEEQLTKALDRKVWLPSGGSLVIDRTEAMTVIDVNTGKFVGQGGNLEETVTKNNLEAAEEIVRQLRLRDIGGIIVVDFIDMVLESNRDLVLRRLIECLGRDRTKHQVAEVTSLGLVQMTRKRIGQGLLEVFSTTCDSCGGRGHHVSLHLPEAEAKPVIAKAGKRKGKGVDPADVIAKAAEATEVVDAEVVEAETVDA
jgi:ribonuclease E